MAEGYEFRMEGLEGLERRMRLLPGRLERKVIRRATRLGANTVRTAVRRRAPHGPTGRLRRSIVTRYSRRRSQRAGKGAVVYTVRNLRDVFYAFFLEMGTRFMAARPFFRPAFESSKRDALRRIGKELWAGIERELRKLRQEVR